MGFIALKVGYEAFQCGRLLIAFSSDPLARPVKVLEFIFSEFIPELEAVMLGNGHEPADPKLLRESLVAIDEGNVAEELKTFIKECKWICLSP